MSEDSKAQIFNIYFCIKDNIELVIEQLKQNVTETFIKTIRWLLE